MKMNIEELKRQFIVDDDALKARLETLVQKVCKHCQIHKQGQVLIMNAELSSKEQVMLTLAARAIASQLDVKITSSVSIGEIVKSTGLPANQIRARGIDLIRTKFAESPKRGVYRAIPYKVEPFLDSLSPPERPSAATASERRE
jgi:hypothetical protein